MVGFSQEETYLYDPNILLKLDFHQSPAKFNPFISAAYPGEDWLKVRPLKDGDYDRGFLQLLSQLTKVGDVSRTQFLTRFSQMKASGDYFVTVIEDTRNNSIIGAASLIIERKFIHNCSIVRISLDTAYTVYMQPPWGTSGSPQTQQIEKASSFCVTTQGGCRGRLEDVVVNDTYRGKQLGKLIVVTVSLLARHMGCYKMTLDCKDKLIKFYTSLGYELVPGNSNSMTIRYDEVPMVKHNATSFTSETSGSSCQTVSLDFGS